MVRLGLQLTLRTGREAIVRLVLTALAVAIGVTVLLAVLADYHAFEATSQRPCWECTMSAPAGASNSNSELWKYTENIYQGRFVEELDVAALGPDAPVVPGLHRLPTAGQYYASPALARLIKTVPYDELGQRFPGTEAGTIGYQALSGPTGLVAIVGYPPAQLAALPDTVKVDKISTAADVQGTTGIYKLAFGIGAIVVLFPLMMLINTATRLAAARREERFAAMRLVGATPRQVNVIATVEAVVGSLLGTLLGVAVFTSGAPGIGQHFLFWGQVFRADRYSHGARLCRSGHRGARGGGRRFAMVPPAGEDIPARCQPKGDTAGAHLWRLVPLLVGIPLFVVPLLDASKGLNNNNPTVSPLIFVGLFLILVGLVMSGSWLTMQAARVLGRAGRGGSALLASRRLADSPKTAFRAVSGLVLAVFVGSMIAALVPVINGAQSSLGGQASSLTNVLRAPYDAGPGAGQPAAKAVGLIKKLEAYPGVSVVPIYANSDFNPGFEPTPRPGKDSQYDSIISCASLRQLPALGKCAPGVNAVYANANNDLLTDNPLEIELPIVALSNPVGPSNTGGPAAGDAAGEDQ